MVWGAVQCLIPLPGILIDTSRQFDTPCFFGRDVKEFKKFAKCWYGDKLLGNTPDGLSSGCETRRSESTRDSAQLRRSLILPSQLLNVGSSEQRRILGAFVDDLQEFLDVPADRTSIDDVWDEKPPQEAAGQPLKAFLRPDVCQPAAVKIALCLLFNLKCVRSPLAVISIPFGRRSPPSTTTIKQRFTNFRSCLPRKAFDCGKRCLLVSPRIFVESLWFYRDQARSVSPEQHEEALESLYIYKRWLLDTYLQTGRSNPVLVLPLGEVGPNHRDEWPRCVSQTTITNFTLTQTLVMTQRVTSNCGNHSS